ncbi:MAG: hypothetical protein R3Y10_07500 [Ferrimonas sp.]
MKQRTLTRPTLGALALCALFTANVYANNGPSQNGQSQGQRPPPQEAIDACKGQKSGASVEFSGPRGDTISATCVDKDGQLIAVPAQREQRPPARS